MGKVSTDVARRNIDKSDTIKALTEELKVKDVEIACLVQERDLRKIKYETFVSMVEEIGDDILKVRLHLESQVPKEFPSAMHYIRTMIKLVLEDEKVRIPEQPKDPVEEVEKAQAAVVRKIATYKGLL